METVSLSAVGAQHFQNPEQMMSVQLEIGVVQLIVVQCVEHPAHALRSCAPITIELRGPASPLLAQGTYACAHPVIGEHSLFIVPIARDAHHTRYEVVFN
jgi:hypothetical protein